MHVLLDDLLRRQHECVGVWQVVAAGWTPRQAERRLRAAGLRSVDAMDGVWTSVRGEMTDIQRWSAATRTAPGTGLTLTAAARLHEAVPPARTWERVVNVMRRGDGGPRRHGDVKVWRRRRIQLVVARNIPVLPLVDVVVELTPHLGDAALRRMVIEAIRLRKLTVPQIRDRVGSARGAPRLRAVLDAVADLPIAGNRSNAEGEALVRMKAAGSRIPETNKKVAGFDVYDPDAEW